MRLFGGRFSLRIILFWLVMWACLQQPAHAQRIEDLQVMPAPQSTDPEADNACAILASYSEGGITDPARMKPFLAACNREPDPGILCSIIFVFYDRHQPNPGLIPPPGCEYK